ncbi:formylglycine-generating enzyme family protein [Sideroxydans sp.]
MNTNPESALFSRSAFPALFSMMPILALSLTVAGDVFAAPAGVTVTKHKAVKSFSNCAGCPKMVIVPAGHFEMGSPEAEAGRGDDEGPLHQVKVARFALGKYEVTRGEFAAFVKATKHSSGDRCGTLEEGMVEDRKGDWLVLHYGQSERHPIGCISWDDAQAYVKWLSRRSGKKYRLPTEAEWEYAARAGTTTSRFWGDDADLACGYANAADKTAQSLIEGASSWGIHACVDGFDFTSPVGSFKANAFGLHDMLGNAWEWTEDSYHESYVDAPLNGKAWLGDGEKRVLRGGSWNNGPRNVRSAGRNSSVPGKRFSFFGFRVARTLP